MKIGVIFHKDPPAAPFLVFRAGTRGFSHRHEDALSLDFSLHGVACLVDPGISGYGPTGMTAYYRSAASHNMILIDGKRPDFSWLPPAGCSFEGGANTAGFQTLTGTVHRWHRGNGDILTVDRSVSFFVPERKSGLRSAPSPAKGPIPEFPFDQISNRAGYGIVQDRIRGRGKADVSVCWQFAPRDIVPDEENRIIRKATSKGRGMALIPYWRAILTDLQRSEGGGDLLGGWNLTGGSERIPI